MQRIRIGNDVRLNLTLRGPRTYDQANIKQLKCYLINTSMLDYFPVDCFWNKHVHGCGCVNDRCGHPKYHALPHCRYYDCCHNDCNRYSHSLCCMLDPHGCNPAAGPGVLPPKYNKPYDAVNCCACEDFTYLAYSRVLPKANSIQCYFPAKDQMFCGVYKLVVQAMIYEPGWGRTDLHTYTMDYGDILQLVDDKSGASGDITLDVDKDDLMNKNILSIRVKGDLNMYGNTSLRLGELDTRDHQYYIEVELENGSVLEYTPDNWPYEQLDFHAAKTGVITIDQHTGLIKALDQDNTISTYVTVSAKNNEVSTGFNVTVVGGDYDYIGFLPVRPFPENMEDDYKYGFNRKDQSFETKDQEAFNAVGVENVNLALLTKVDSLTDATTVENDTDGQYLWIVTRQPILYAANINTQGVGNVGAATYIPLTKPQQKLNDSRYYYCCPNPMKRNLSTGGSTVYVKFKNK